MITLLVLAPIYLCWHKKYYRRTIWNHYLEQTARYQEAVDAAQANPTAGNLERARVENLLTQAAEKELHRVTTKKRWIRV